MFKINAIKLHIFITCILLAGILAGCGSNDRITGDVVGNVADNVTYDISVDNLLYTDFDYIDEDRNTHSYFLNFTNNSIMCNEDNMYACTIEASKMQELKEYIVEYNNTIYSGQYWPDTDEYPEMEILFNYTCTVLQDSNNLEESSDSAESSNDTRKCKIDGCREYGFPEGWEAFVQTVEDVIASQKADSLQTIDYGSLYLEAVEDNFGGMKSSYTYKLIYLNDDDIPELYYSGDCEAAGSGLFYINPENAAELVMMGRISGLYEERGNLFWHSQGHMGYYYDQFFAFVDGDIVLIEDGDYSDKYDETVMGPDGELGDFVIETAHYNGKEVTYEEYCDCVDNMVKGRQMINLQEWYFYKDGQPITDDEYWQHFGEDGYVGGTTLISYDELVAELAVNSMMSSTNEDNSSVTGLYDQFLAGQLGADYNGTEVYLKVLIDDEVDNYVNSFYDIDVLNTEMLENNETWKDRLYVNYIVMDSDSEPFLFVDIMVLDPANGHSLYRLSAVEDTLHVDGKVDLSWCDWESFFKSGYIMVNHGQHFPSVATYNRVDASMESMSVYTDMQIDEKAYLVVAGPDSWATESDYEGCAENVLIWKEGEEDITVARINDYLGVDQDKDRIEMDSLDFEYEYKR